MDDVKALDGAKAALQDALDARDVLEHATAKAQTGILTAKRAAHLLLVRHLLAQQAELAREADTIRAALADVEARWAQNIAQLHDCHLRPDEMGTIAAPVPQQPMTT